MPIKLATGEIAGMLCMDTLKVPRVAAAGPSSRRTRTSAKLRNASVALNAAAEMRAAKLALAAEEQAAIAEALAATDDPKPELADGQEPPPDPEPEPDEPGHPRKEKTRMMPAFANIAKTRKALEAAKANWSRKQKRFSAVDTLLDGVDDEALLEIRSLQRAPKYTWKALKAALWITGHKKYEFQTWALTRKLIGDDKIIKEFKDIDPLEMTLTDKARQGSRKCLRGIRDSGDCQGIGRRVPFLSVVRRIHRRGGRCPRGEVEHRGSRGVRDGSEAESGEEGCRRRRRGGGGGRGTVCVVVHLSNIDFDYSNLFETFETVCCA